MTWEIIMEAYIINLMPSSVNVYKACSIAKSEPEKYHSKLERAQKMNYFK